MQNIVIVANLVVKEEHLEGVYEAMSKLYKLTHQKDEGCIYYELHQDIDNKNSFTFIETWKDEQTLKAHLEKPHFQEFRSFVEDKVEQSSFKKLLKKDI